MPSTMAHCEINANTNETPDCRYWENAELELQEVCLACIVDRQEFTRWMLIASSEALRWFLDNNHDGYRIESLYELTADSQEKTRLKVREVKAWQPGIITVADDGEKSCRLLPLQPVPR